MHFYICPPFKTHLQILPLFVVYSTELSPATVMVGCRIPGDHGPRFFHKIDAADWWRKPIHGNHPKPFQCSSGRLTYITGSRVTSVSQSWSLRCSSNTIRHAVCYIWFIPAYQEAAVSQWLRCWKDLQTIDLYFTARHWRRVYCLK